MAPARSQHKSPISNVILVEASAGGYHALVEILRDLPADIPAAIIVILHMPLGSSHDLAASLGRFTRIPTVMVDKSEPLRHGTVFVPPAGRSVILDRGTITVETSDRPVRPVTRINRMFVSAANTYGRHVIGVILSGLLKDGTDGLRAVHEAGGLTVVQDPREAEYPEMPASAMQGLPVTFCSFAEARSSRRASPSPCARSASASLFS